MSTATPMGSNSARSTVPTSFARLTARNLPRQSSARTASMTRISALVAPHRRGGAHVLYQSDYVKFFFTDEIGNIMLGAAILLQVIGYLIIRQIVKIEI